MAISKKDPEVQYLIVKTHVAGRVAGTKAALKAIKDAMAEFMTPEIADKAVAREVHQFIRELKKAVLDAVKG